MIKEKDIRPTELMLEQKKIFQKDMKLLSEQKNFFIDVSCPACFLKNDKVIFRKYDFSYLLCKNCSTVYISPRPTEKILSNYYSVSENYKWWAQEIFPASEDRREKNIIIPRLEKIKQLISENFNFKPNLLEIGAGFGTFCKIAKSSNLFNNVIAVEPVKDLAEKCCLNNIDEVINDCIENIKLDTKIDIIVSFEVLEHIFSPIRFLEISYNLLSKKGGIIILTCPNVNGFDVKILGSSSDVFDGEHLNYFNTESIKKLLSTAGFSILEVTTPGQLDVEIVKNKVMDGHRIDYSFLNQILSSESDSESFQKFLSDNLLSSHMFIIGKK